jgi:hypothetical protein
MICERARINARYRAFCRASEDRLRDRPARRSGIRRGGRPGSAIRVDAADVADFQQRFDQVDSESP